MPAEVPTPVPRPGVLPRLVGLFALWQLAFIPLANLFEFIPQRPSGYDIDPPVESSQHWGRFTDIEPVQEAAERAGFVLASWAELTGQDQGWVMFTPGFPPYTVTLVTEFRFPDGGTDRVHSPFEPDPANPRSRWPVLHDRRFNHEANLFMLAWHCHPESLAERPGDWRSLPEKVRESERLITRWLQWQAKQYTVTHPEKQPVELVLILRYLPTPPPGEATEWTRPASERPFARWFPDGPREAGVLPLEGFDPVEKRWVRLKPWSRP